jgi:uncharacterized protein YcbK (DUF882 family)
MNMGLYQKGIKAKISEHFCSTDFDCQCKRPTCKTTKIAKELLEALEAVITDTGLKLTFTSAYRCPKHNTEVGGAKSSQHPQGTATDIICSEKDTALYESIEKHFNAIGDGRNWKGFVHGDVRNIDRTKIRFTYPIS